MRAPAPYTPTSDMLVVPSYAMPIVSPTDPMPTWDPALTGYGRPAEFPAWPEKVSEDYVKKSLATRQDFREVPSYPGDWQTGLFDCCAPPGGCETCLMGWVCPWTLIGQNTDRLPPGHYCANGTCLFGGFVYLGCCMLPCIGGTLVAVIHHCRVRGSIRRTYGLPPDPFPDCCVVMLCPCCAAIQEHNELDRRGATQWNPPPKDYPPITRNAFPLWEPPVEREIIVVGQKKPQLPAPPMQGSLTFAPMLPAPIYSTPPMFTPPPADDHGRDGYHIQGRQQARKSNYPIPIRTPADRLLIAPEHDH